MPVLTWYALLGGAIGMGAVWVAWIYRMLAVMLTTSLGR